jgi:hypothetical protein
MLNKRKKHQPIKSLKGLFQAAKKGAVAGDKARAKSRS